MFWKVFRLAPSSVAVYPFAFIVSWVVTLLSYVLSPLIAGISLATGSNQVPWLGWFYTHDASLDGGVEQGKDGYDPAATGFKLWWQRVCWICRNPGYRFNAYVLGLPAEGTTIIFREGDEWPNFRLWTVLETKSGRRYFGYRGKNDQWFGWNYMAYAGRHLLKSKPI